MLTVITETTLKPGQEAQWDAAYHRRADAVTSQNGWISFQLLKPVDEPNKRVVVGSWQSRDDWMEWHKSPVFLETREQMDEIEQAENRQERWFEVVTRDMDK